MRKSNSRAAVGRYKSDGAFSKNLYLYHTMSTHVSEVISNSSNVAKLASVAILASLLLYIKDHKDKESELPLPPGPPGHWLYGNDLPKA